MLTGPALVSAVLLLRDALYERREYGPFVLVYGTDYARIMDQDYSEWCSTHRHRQRLQVLEGIVDVEFQDGAHLELHSLSSPFTIASHQPTQFYLS